MIKKLLESKSKVSEVVTSGQVTNGSPVVLPISTKVLLTKFGYKAALTDEDKNEILSEVLSAVRKRRKKRYGYGYYGGIVVRDPSRPEGSPSNPDPVNPELGYDRGWNSGGGTPEGSPWTNSGGNTQL